MPMGEYDDFADCVAAVKRKHPTWDGERCRRYCGAIQQTIEGAISQHRRPKKERSR